jgi:hypothetical protein
MRSPKGSFAWGDVPYICALPLRGRAPMYRTSARHVDADELIRKVERSLVDSAICRRHSAASTRRGLALDQFSLCAGHPAFEDGRSRYLLREYRGAAPKVTIRGQIVVDTIADIGITVRPRPRVAIRIKVVM